MTTSQLSVASPPATSVASPATNVPVTVSAASSSPAGLRSEPV